MSGRGDLHRWSPWRTGERRGLGDRGEELRAERREGFGRVDDDDDDETWLLLRLNHSGVRGQQLTKSPNYLQDVKKMDRSRYKKKLSNPLGTGRYTLVACMLLRTSSSAFNASQLIACRRYCN